jgi:hypothetical protein
MKTSTWTLGIVVVLLTISVGLAATNPNTVDYEAFLLGLVNQAVERMDQPGQRDSRDMVRQLLQSQGRQLAASLLAPTTVRRNYGLFSVFETRVLGVNVLVLGIGNRFVPIKGVDELMTKLRQVSRPPR